MKSDQSIFLLGILLILSYALTQLFSTPTTTEPSAVVVENASVLQSNDSTRINYSTQKEIVDTLSNHSIDK